MNGALVTPTSDPWSKWISVMEMKSLSNLCLNFCQGWIHFDQCSSNNYTLWYILSYSGYLTCTVLIFVSCHSQSKRKLHHQFILWFITNFVICLVFCLQCFILFIALITTPLQKSSIWNIFCHGFMKSTLLMALNMLSQKAFRCWLLPYIHCSALVVYRLTNPGTAEAFISWTSSKFK